MISDKNAIKNEYRKKLAIAFNFRVLVSSYFTNFNGKKYLID